MFDVAEELQSVIERLGNAVVVSNDSCSDPERGYPFATGYSRSAMEDSIEDLKQILYTLQNGQN